MFAWFRAGLVAALFVVLATPSLAAQKTYQDDALDDAAITLIADLKDQAGTVDKPLIKLKQQADVLLKSQDLSGAADVYVQIVTVAPNDAAAWRRLADIWLSIPVSDEDDGSTRFENARTAAYISYQRATNAKDEAAALITLANAFGKRDEWRQALNVLKIALALDETPDLRATYASLREKYGFRVSNFSVDSRLRLPACLLPILREASEAHRLRALRRGRWPRQAGAFGRRPAALRRGARARRHLFHHAPRRSSLDG